MTRPTNPLFDERVAAWLEDAPDQAPGQVLETVLAAFPSVPQRRASLIGASAGFRTPSLGRLLAVAAVLVLLSLLGVVLLGGGLRLGLNTTDWQRFEASDLAYTVRLPPTWKMTPGVAGQPDVFTGSEGMLRIGHEAIPPGTDQDGWRDARYALISSQQFNRCPQPDPDGFEIVAVGTGTARLYGLPCVSSSIAQPSSAQPSDVPIDLWLALAAVGERGFDLRFQTVGEALPIGGKDLFATVLRTFLMRGGSAPSPAPLDLVPFTASRYGYSIGYPRTWGKSAATTSLVGFETPWGYSSSVDSVDLVPGPGPLIAPYGTVLIASAEVPAGTTLATWTAETALKTCGSPLKQEAIDLAGQPATLTTFAACYGLFHQWVTAMRGTTGWHVIWLNETGSEAADRAIFEQILATFVFPPG